MRWTFRGLVVVLVCLTVGVLLVAFASGTAPGPPAPAAASSVSAAASTQTQTAAAQATSAAFPVLTVPGAASTVAGASKTLSTSPATLGLQGAPAMDPTLGPPSWVKAGTRLTFYSAAASVAQSSFAWVEDPNGDWEDPATGTHYRRTDETGEGVTTGGSGDGYGQIDVLAVDGTNVTLAANLYVIDRSTGTFIPGPTTGATVPGGEVVGTWINPARLAQLEDVRQNGLLVLRGDYPLNGTTYRAVSFAVTTQGSYQQYTYDTASGVLLSATTSTASAPSPVSAPGESPPQGNTELTVTYFEGARQRSVPGIDGVNPDWVARTSRLDYAGTFNWANPVAPDTGAITAPMSMGVALEPGGDAWASYSEQTSIPAINSTSTGSGVTGPLGLYWLSQKALSALAQLPARQVIDKDPITGEQDTLYSVGRDQATGRNLVSILTQLPGLTTLAGYDMTTGVLATYAAQVPASGTTVSLQLQGGP